MKPLFFKSIACLALLMPLQMPAQRHLQDSTFQLHDVVISTTRIPEAKQNAAASVTIIDHQQLEAVSKVAPDMSTLLGLLAPGMALSSNTTSSRSQTLRG